MGSHPTKGSAQRIAQEAKTEELRQSQPSFFTFAPQFLEKSHVEEYLSFFKSHVEEYLNTQQKWKRKTKHSSSWWQLKYFSFSPLLGEDSHFDQYFSDGLKPPTRHQFHISLPAFVHPLHSSFLSHWNPPGGAPVRGLKKRGWIDTPLKKWRAGT